MCLGRVSLPDRFASIGDFLDSLFEQTEHHVLAVTRCRHPSAIAEVHASPSVPIREEQKYDRGMRPLPRYN